MQRQRCVCVLPSALPHIISSRSLICAICLNLLFNCSVFVHTVSIKNWKYVNGSFLWWFVCLFVSSDYLGTNNCFIALSVSYHWDSIVTLAIYSFHSWSGTNTSESSKCVTLIFLFQVQITYVIKMLPLGHHPAAYSDWTIQVMPQMFKKRETLLFWRETNSTKYGRPYGLEPLSWLNPLTVRCVFYVMFWSFSYSAVKLRHGSNSGLWAAQRCSVSGSLSSVWF